MKIRLLFPIYFFSLLLFFCCNISAQKLVQEGNQWNISVSSFFPLTTSFSVRIGEDTIINNTNYHKIYYSADTLNTAWEFQNEWVREDSTKKVFLKSGNQPEMIYYDFELKVNDSILIDHFCHLRVINIDSIQINNGEHRKRLTLQNINDPFPMVQYWIEGIGTNLGVFDHHLFCYVDLYLELLCFYANGELLYPKNPPTCFITKTKDISENKIKIYPNPVSDILNIENVDNQIQSYVLYDFTGSLVSKGDVESQSFFIPMYTLPDGLYQLFVRDKQGNTFIQKVIKQY